MHSKLHKNQQKQQETENISLTPAIVIPGDITTSDVHRQIEDYQTELRYTGFPKITKPGAAYELIKLGIKSKSSNICN